MFGQLQDIFNKLLELSGENGNALLLPLRLLNKRIFYFTKTTYYLSEVTCGVCELKVDICGQAKCISGGCCPAGFFLLVVLLLKDPFPGVPTANCFVQPCFNQKNECPAAAHCQDNYCGGCNAVYYNADGVEISTNSSACLGTNSDLIL